MGPFDSFEFRNVFGQTGQMFSHELLQIRLLESLDIPRLVDQDAGSGPFIDLCRVNLAKTVGYLDSGSSVVAAFKIVESF